MIVKDDSPITRIPKELSVREILILEGLRYSANMALVAYGRLRACLLDLSTETKPVDFWYAALTDVWGVIDSANRFYKLFIQLNNQGTNPMKKEYDNFKKLRDGFQHIDEWIDKKHVKEPFPLFGQLSWVYYNPTLDLEKRSKIFVFAPGIQHGEKTYQSPNPLGKEFRVPIDQISITANQRAQNEPPIKVEMVPIIIAIEETVKQVENNLDVLYNSFHNRADIFSSDLTFRFDIQFSE